MRLHQPDSVWSQDAVKVFAGAEDDVQDEVIRVSGVVDGGGHRHIFGRAYVSVGPLCWRDVEFFGPVLKFLDFFNLNCFSSLVTTPHLSWRQPLNG